MFFHLLNAEDADACLSGLDAEVFQALSGRNRFYNLDTALEQPNRGERAKAIAGFEANAPAKIGQFGNGEARKSFRGCA